MLNRRKLIQHLTALPLLGGVLSTIPFSTALAKSKTPKRDLYKELGVRTFINAAGTLTYMTGSLMHDYVVDAIQSSWQEFCLLDELQDKVGAKVASMVHSE